MKKFFATLILLMLFATTALGAGNPFADVPADHWSYDAVALLASRGGIRGHANAKLRGGRQATRYEMASLVARTLEKIDTEKISAEDRELLQKLASEFKGELDAMGLKVTELKDRVSSLRKDLGKLRLKGVLWLDAEWGGQDGEKWYAFDPKTGAWSPTHQGSTQPKFEYHRARFYIEKVVDQNTFFQMRVNFNALDGKDSSAFEVDRLWFSTKLPWNIKGTFGYQTTDWDKEYGLYNAKFGGWGDEESFWTNLKFIGFDFRKDFGKVDVDLYVGRNMQSIDGYDALGSYDKQSYMTYGLKLGYKSEKLKFGLFGRYAKFDGDKDNNYAYVDTREDDEYPLIYGSLNGADMLNYGAYANYKILNGLEIKGTFNRQQFNGADPAIYSASGSQEGEEGYVPVYQEDKFDSASNYWQVAIEADESLLKFCSIWAQYGEVDEGFIHNPKGFNQIGYLSVLANFGGEYGLAIDDYKFWKVGIHKDITKKLKAYVMYQEIRGKNNHIDNTINFGVGLRYQYTPAIAFQLQYDWRDYGEGLNSDYGQNFGIQGREDLFRFRTIISF